MPLYQAQGLGGRHPRCAHRSSAGSCLRRNVSQTGEGGMGQEPQWLPELVEICRN